MRVSEEASKQGRCHPADDSEMRSELRVVAIASRHSFGDRIIRRFAEAGIRLDALVVAVHQNPRQEPHVNGARARLREWRARLSTHVRAWRRWRQMVRQISVVDSPSDRRLHSVLTDARPDVLILAGTGILPADLLTIPRVVTLNTHPGLLPWVRGVCPFENALLRGVPLGVSVHAVDAGIDTGPVIRRVLLPVSAKDTDRLSVTARLEEAAIGALTDVVSSLLRGDPLHPRPQTSRHPYGRWVSTAERERAVALLEDGEAVRLYREWSATIGGDVIPNEDHQLDTIPRRSDASR